METKNMSSRHPELVSESSASSGKIGRPWNKFRVTKYNGFTLVELIVVITILTILGTIGFIQIQGYAGSARDSVRIENLTNLHKGLSLFQVVSGTYPMPEGFITITASGSEDIGYQWFAKEWVTTLAKLSKWATQDPLDANMYTTYSVNKNMTKMQLMAFLEDGSNITALIPDAYASAGSDYSKRHPTTLGDTLGIILGNTGITLNQPIQEKYEVDNSFTGVDIWAGTTDDYKAVFSKTDIVSGSGWALLALKASYTSPRSLPARDTSLLAHWDMSTTYTDNSWTIWMADLSGNKNHGPNTNGWLLTPLGWVQGIHSMATSTTNGTTISAMSTPILMQTGSSFTVNLVYKINHYLYAGGTIGHGILSIGRSAAAAELFQIKLDGSSYITFKWWSTVIGPAINIDEWHMLSIVYNGDSFRVYDNWVFFWTLDATGYPMPSRLMFMLNRAVRIPVSWTPTSLYGFNTVDDARVYNRALSDSEILSLYNAMK